MRRQVNEHIDKKIFQVQNKIKFFKETNCYGFCLVPKLSIKKKI